MTRVLKRPIFDKISSTLFSIIIASALYFHFFSFDLLEKILFLFLSIIVFFNVLFILLTPIAKINESKILIYSDNLPILFDIKPKEINLTDVKSLIFSEKLIFPRGLFKLYNGDTVIHAFPSKSEKRINQFFSFIQENTEIDIVK